MANFNFDETKVAEALLACPLVSLGGKAPLDAMTKPGNCVKSVESEDNGMPKWFGRIVKYSDVEVIVVSHQDGFSKPFVWKGNTGEYHSMWLCD